jgi:hypothetical protein
MSKKRLIAHIEIVGKKVFVNRPHDYFKDGQSNNSHTFYYGSLKPLKGDKYLFVHESPHVAPIVIYPAGIVLIEYERKSSTDKLN